MKKYLLFLAVFAAGFLAGTAAARRKPPPKNPCAEDGERFCSAAETPQAFMQCLREDKAYLAESCLERVVLAGTTAAVVRDRGNCRKDSEELCKDSGNNKMPCLFLREKELSEACRKDVQQLKRASMIIPTRLRVPPQEGNAASVE